MILEYDENDRSLVMYALGYVNEKVLTKIKLQTVRGHRSKTKYHVIYNNAYYLDRLNPASTEKLPPMTKTAAIKVMRKARKFGYMKDRLRMVEA
jgi:hypothetical protein